MACTKDLEMRGWLHERAGDRIITNVADLIAAWVQTYGEVVRPKLRVRYFQMRETTLRARWQQLERALTGRDIRWALTGADGAAARCERSISPSASSARSYPSCCSTQSPTFELTTRPPSCQLRRRLRG